MSSSPTNTFTNRRRLPLSSKRRSAKPGWATSSAFERLPDRGAFDVDLAGTARQWPKLSGDTDFNAHVLAPIVGDEHVTASLPG